MIQNGKGVPAKPPKHEKVFKVKKLNIIFNHKIESYFRQLFLTPLLWVAGTILISLFYRQFEFNTIIFVIFILFYIRIIGVSFPDIRPLQIIVEYLIKEDRIKLLICHKRSHITGYYLRTLRQDNDYITFVIEGKYGVETITIPIKLLSENLFQLMVETIENMSIGNMYVLAAAFQNTAFRTQNYFEEGSFFNLHINRGLSFTWFKLITLVISLAMCSFIVYSAI